eukprot:PhM_4_TR3020/c2_g4_i1/m.41483
MGGMVARALRLAHMSLSLDSVEHGSPAATKDDGGDVKNKNKNKNKTKNKSNKKKLTHLVVAGCGKLPNVTTFGDERTEELTRAANFCDIFVFLSFFLLCVIYFIFIYFCLSLSCFLIYLTNFFKHEMQLLAFRKPLKIPNQIFSHAQTKNDKARPSESMPSW